MGVSIPNDLCLRAGEDAMTDDALEAIAKDQMDRYRAHDSMTPEVRLARGYLSLVERVTRLVEAAQAVLDESAVEFADERLSYVTVQMTPGVLEALRAALQAFAEKTA